MGQDDMSDARSRKSVMASVRMTTKAGATPLFHRSITEAPDATVEWILNLQKAMIDLELNEEIQKDVTVFVSSKISRAKDNANVRIGKSMYRSITWNDFVHMVHTIISSSIDTLRKVRGVEIANYFFFSYLFRALVSFFLTTCKTNRDAKKMSCRRSLLNSFTS
jgi:hypothetical protein